MTAVAATTLLVALGMLLSAGVIGLALYIKGSVKASARIGRGSFDIETTEKTRQDVPR